MSDFLYAPDSLWTAGDKEAPEEATEFSHSSYKRFRRVYGLGECALNPNALYHRFPKIPFSYFLGCVLLKLYTMYTGMSGILMLVRALETLNPKTLNPKPLGPKPIALHLEPSPTPRHLPRASLHFARE